MPDAEKMEDDPGHFFPRRPPPCSPPAAPLKLEPTRATVAEARPSEKPATSWPPPKVPVKAYLVKSPSYTTRHDAESAQALLAGVNLIWAQAGVELVLLSADLMEGTDAAVEATMPGPRGGSAGASC